MDGIYKTTNRGRESGMPKEPSAQIEFLYDYAQMTYEEAGKKYGVSPSTVYRWAKKLVGVYRSEDGIVHLDELKTKYCG